MRTDLDPRGTNAVAAPDPLLERLRELQDAGDAPYDYSEFSRRYARRRMRHTQLPLRWTAAALAVLVGGWVVQHRLSPMLGEVPTTAIAPQPMAAPVLPPASDAERWLNAQPRSAIVWVPTQMAVTEVEDQITKKDLLVLPNKLNHRFEIDRAKRMIELMYLVNGEKLPKFEKDK